MLGDFLLHRRNFKAVPWLDLSPLNLEIRLYCTVQYQAISLPGALVSAPTLLLASPGTDATVDRHAGSGKDFLVQE